MKPQRQNELQCTFDDAERNHLLDGMRMSTDDKIRSFESMLDFAWRSGAIRQLRDSLPETAKVDRSLHSD
ncbi:MAG: hypothetical protein KGL13_04235 [Gammaproteobacteria bacterium]|nr:hypothetical protein [Gammaproteobacteria bacterium]